MILRDLQAHELPQLLALYRHLHEHDEPPLNDTAQAVWSEALANPRIRYFGGFMPDDTTLVSS